MDFKKFFKKETEKKAISQISALDIQKAYDRRKKDLDSLKAYDRGEKDIHAPNLSEIVRSIRKAS